MQITATGAAGLRQMDPQLPALYQNHFCIRRSAVRAPGVQLSVQGAPSPTAPVTWELWRAGHTPDARLASATTNAACTVRTPATPDAIYVRVRSGGQSAEAVIWFIEASVRMTGAGVSVGAGNPAWPRIRSHLVAVYNISAGALSRTGHFCAQVGSGANAATRYGQLTEIVATFQPAAFSSVPIRAFLARAIVSSQVAAVDVNNAALPASRDLGVSNRSPGADDTSTIFQDVGSGRMTPRAQVFDYDFPGSVMSSDNQLGDTHRWNVVFRQAALIGRPLGLADAESRGLVMSPWEQWQVQRVAICQMAGAPPRVLYS